MALHSINYAGQNLHCQSMTWPIMTMTRLRLIFPCIMCGKIISGQGFVINHLKNIHVFLVLSCMLCGNTFQCLRPTNKHTTSIHALPFQPSGIKLNLRLCHDNIYCSSPQPCLMDDMTAFDPMNRQHMGFQDQKNKWNILGKHLNHIITKDELVKLLTVELAPAEMLEHHVNQKQNLCIIL